MTRPHDPGGGGGTFKYPVPQNSMTTGGDVRKNMVNHRYGGPVQTFSRGTGRFKREYVEPTAAVGPTPQGGTVCQTRWCKTETQDRCVNPVRLPSVGAKMTNPEYPMMLWKPRNTVGESRRSWNQCDKGVQTLSHWDKREKPSSVALGREVMTTPTVVCRDRGKEERSNRYQKTVVAAVETNANGTKEGKDQLMKSEGHRTATQAVQINCSRVTEPMSGPVRPVVPKIDVVNDTDTMHCAGIDANDGNVSNE